MQEVLLADPQVKSISMQGQIYNQGQNLQALDTVFHLDTVMNAQDMSQREARVWRQGNLHDDVDIFELVPTFGNYENTRAKGDLDLTVSQLDDAYVTLFQQIFDDM